MKFLEHKRIVPRTKKMSLMSDEVVASALNRGRHGSTMGKKRDLSSTKDRDTTKA